MATRLLILAVLLFSFLISTTFSAVIDVRWCVISSEEQKKCLDLQRNIIEKISHIPVMKQIKFQCIMGTGLFDCMHKIKSNKADLMTAESGLAYGTSELYQLRPVAAENYGPSNNKNEAILHYFATIVMRSNNIKNLKNLRNATVCSAGVGTADGWIMPLSKLLTTLKVIPVTQCNSRVQTATAFFNSMCAPGSLTSVFNPFGDNPNTACNRCYKDLTNRAPDFCSYKNLYAGSYGAVKCLKESNLDLAFTRHGEASLYAVDKKIPNSQFKLLCPDGTTADISPTKMINGSNTTAAAEMLSTVDPKCNWGRIPSRLILTSETRTPDVIYIYQRFLGKIVEYFGDASNGTFNIFTSLKYGRRDLMFSDWTKTFYDLKRNGDNALSSIFHWVEKVPSGEPNINFPERAERLRFCPLPVVQWCVITSEEMEKCANMKLAFSARGLKPDLNCIKGGSSINCMRLIQKGFADLITLDAAELYLGGKYFGLVPIAAEYYGDGTKYYGVAIAKKIDRYLLISNLKYKKTCHSGISKATGWVIPLNVVLETGQVSVFNGKLMNAYAELISRACIPGTLSNEYNPTRHNPINLCEACASGGNDRCQRNNRELYYGDSGAFRCLVEGGDVAFARHTTVRENTGGRNPAYWARNRRSEDYELLCRDGSRRSVYDWKSCNLGEIPGSAVVTAGYKTKEQKEQMWKLLQYALEYFSSDSSANEFRMFDSGYGRSDLLFQDSAETLVAIPETDQTYEKWLGYGFLRMISTLEWVSKYSEQSGMSSYVSASSGILPSLINTLFLSLLSYFILRFICE